MASTVLDSNFLKSFINDHIVEFRKTLERMLTDDPDVGKAIKTLASQMTGSTIDISKPLHIGRMAHQEGGIQGGGELNTAVQQGAGELERILEAQNVLFEEIEQALWDTIDELAQAQGKNLEGITPEDFLDIFEDVDSGLENPGPPQQGQEG